MEHLEIEFKMLLKENIFKKILSDYKNQIKDSYQQTNYYLFHPLSCLFKHAATPARSRKTSSGDS